MLQNQLKTSPLQNWLAERTGLGRRLDPESLRSYQLDRLRELMDYVRARSSFYRAKLAPVNAAGLKDLSDLAETPCLSPEELRIRGEDMVCIPQSRVARIITASTSGTSGKPKRLYFSEEDLELCLDFFACGMTTMVESGDLVEIRLPGHSPDGVVDLLQTGLRRIGVESVRRDPAGSQGPPEGDCLVGLAVDLHQLAETYPEARPKSVLLCADYVPEAIVENLRKLWRTEVFTHYGSTESGQGGGVECSAHDGYHLREADLLIEIIEPATGRPAPPGAVGEIVLTTLSRRAMPLIRYRTGDMARRLERPCACGSNLFRLGKVEGRYDNSIRLKSGAFISIHLLDEIMFRFPGILDYRAALNSDLDLKLSVKPHPAGLNPAAIAERIMALIDPSLPIDLSLDPNLRPAPQAKRIIRRV